MGLFDKVKNLFTDEVEEPIKSEVIQVEIPAPAKEIKMSETSEEPITDNVTIKNEEKVSAPIFFDDDYFKELEQPKQEVKSSYLKEPPKLKEDKKYFKPTPIISPVYGVLDKNYNKEDITEKKPHNRVYETNTTVTIDEVRKKAFGTLEDDLENTLFGKNSNLFEEVKEEDLFDELEEEQEVEIMEETINIVEEELESVNMVEKEIENQNIVEEEMTRSMEENRPISESELFDLIDSMYEKGE